jgi:hypothetical protein
MYRKSELKRILNFEEFCGTMKKIVRFKGPHLCVYFQVGVQKHIVLCDAQSVAPTLAFPAVEVREANDDSLEPGSFPPSVKKYNAQIVPIRYYTNNIDDDDDENNNFSFI